MFRWLLTASLLVAASSALAQNQGQTVPNGPFTPGHTVRCQNSTCTVIVDAGGSGGSSIGGQGYLTELGITNTGTPFCISDALISNPNGYHQFCLGANSQGGGVISYNAFSGASDLGLTISINGVNYPFPGSGNGNVIGPTSPTPTAGNLVLWNGGLTVKDGGVPISGGSVSITQYGALPNGSDSTAAINACLAAAAARTNGFTTCVADGRFTVNGNISIPNSTILQCTTAPTFVVGQGSQGAQWNTVPALLLGAGNEISATGDGAALVNCNVLNNALTFPLTASSRALYGIGVAVTDGGWGNFHLLGDRIVGWDTAALISGFHPIVNDIAYDGNGQNNQCGSPACVGAMIVTTGNTDLGYWTNVYSGIGYFFNTSSGFCSELPPGNGFTVAGTVDHTAGLFMDNFTIVGYSGINFNFANSAWAGKIWSDNFGQAPFSCSQPSAIGIKVAAGTTLTAQTINISQGQIGLQTAGDLVHIDEIQIGGTLGDAVQLAAAAKNIVVGKLFLSMNNGTGKYCINQTAVGAFLDISHLELTGSCNGGAAPYFANTSGTNSALGRSGQYWNIHSLSLDGVFVPTTTNYFDSHLLAGPGSSTVLTGLQPVITGCAGVGTGGSPGCAFDGNSDVNEGIILITTGSSGVAASGSVTMSAPIVALNTKACALTLAGGWPITSQLISSGGLVFFWATNTSALLANTTYPIAYVCRYY